MPVNIGLVLGAVAPAFAELEAAAEPHGPEVRGEKRWYEFHDGSRTVASITAASGPVCTLLHQM